MKIYGKTAKRNKVMPIFGFVIAALAFYKGIQGISDDGWTFIICGILLLFLSLYKVTPFVSEEGAGDAVSIAGIKKYNIWKWEDINYMFANFTKSAPDVILIVRKGNGHRKTILSPDDIQKVFDWASEKNGRMTIEYNGSREFKVKNRTSMSKAEYEAAHKAVREEVGKPQSFHELAQEARKIKAQKEQEAKALKERKEREALLRRPDLKKVKLVKTTKKLKRWH